MGILPTLSETYNTFNLNTNVFDNLYYKIWEKDAHIEVPETFT
jgi:hypothetical protein